MHPKTLSDLMEFVHVIGAPMDDATRLLRLHSLSEYFLERILLRHLPKGSLITKDERFSYYQKLQIAVALEALNSKTVGALRKLAKIRNRCAHERRPVVTIEEIVQVGQLLGPRFERAMAEFDGDNLEFRALTYALFTELSNQSTAVEIAVEVLNIGHGGEKDA